MSGSSWIVIYWDPHGGRHEASSAVQRRPPPGPGGDSDRNALVGSSPQASYSFIQMCGGAGLRCRCSVGGLFRLSVSRFSMRGSRDLWRAAVFSVVSTLRLVVILLLAGFGVMSLASSEAVRAPRLSECCFLWSPRPYVVKGGNLCIARRVPWRPHTRTHANTHTHTHTHIHSNRDRRIHPSHQRVIMWCHVARVSWGYWLGPAARQDDFQRSEPAPPQPRLWRSSWTLRRLCK